MMPLTWVGAWGPTHEWKYCTVCGGAGGWYIDTPTPRDVYRRATGILLRCAWYWVPPEEAQAAWARHPNERPLWAPMFLTEAVRRRDTQRQANGLLPEGWLPRKPKDLLPSAPAKQALQQLSGDQRTLLYQSLDEWAKSWLRSL